MSHAPNIAIHLTNVVLFIFSIYDFHNLNIPIITQSPKFDKFDPGPTKYLTIWNL
ncbi:hypothetical protein HN011_005263, partial [Eciton burchellii]